MKIRQILLKWRFTLLISPLLIFYVFNSACNNLVKPAEAFKNAPSLSLNNSITDDGLVRVGFSARQSEPDDAEICRMIDDVIRQTLGEKGLAAIVKKGDRVVIKINKISPTAGRPGEKGVGIISDVRIVRYVAEKVREIIGFEGTADLKVVDACYSHDRNPSGIDNKDSFNFVRLERKGKDTIWEDQNADGILDGSSKARLVNLDSLYPEERKSCDVTLASGKIIRVAMPRFLQRKIEAKPGEDYCDVFIGIPVWKSHAYLGITGALKLHYGLRPYWAVLGDTGRPTHSGLNWDLTGIHNKQKLIDYLTALHCVRSYDFALMDALTGNRRGPRNLSFSNDDAETDFFRSFAVMASRDPVALDVTAALLAGYEPSSIGLNRTASENGIGTDDLSRIEIFGLDAFSKHRIFLAKTYGGKNLYPFENGWGGAVVIPAVTNAPEILKISEPEKAEGNSYRFSYEVSAANGLMKTELWCSNEKMIIIEKKEGQITADMSGWKGKNAEYRLAFWDKDFNCTLSEIKNFQF